MTYDIYFHNDFDGRASAAVLLAFLRERGDRIAHYVSVNFDSMPQWLDEKFFKKHKLFTGKRNPAIVVDFPYHPKAAWWFDHHLTAFKKAPWQKKFRPDKFHHHDPSYASACHLVMASLQKSFGWSPPRHIRELAKWLDVIDGAGYTSARQTILMKEPALQANNFIESRTDSKKITLWTIRFLSQKSIEKYADAPIVKESMQGIRRKTAVAVKFYKKNINILGKVMFVDLASVDLGEAGHYAPYYLYPRFVYLVRFRQKQNFFHIGVSANPWRRSENKIHIGELLRKYGGGGHKNVGGVEFKTRAKAERAVRDIIKLLR